LPDTAESAVDGDSTFDLAQRKTLSSVTRHWAYKAYNSVSHHFTYRVCLGAAYNSQNKHGLFPQAE